MYTCNYYGGREEQAVLTLTPLLTMVATYSCAIVYSSHVGLRVAALAFVCRTVEAIGDGDDENKLLIVIIIVYSLLSSVYVQL